MLIILITWYLQLLECCKYFPKNLEWRFPLANYSTLASFSKFDMPKCMTSAGTKSKLTFIVSQLRPKLIQFNAFSQPELVHGTPFKSESVLFEKVVLYVRIVIG